MAAVKAQLAPCNAISRSHHIISYLPEASLSSLVRPSVRPSLVVRWILLHERVPITVAAARAPEVLVGWTLQWNFLPCIKLQLGRPIKSWAKLLPLTQYSYSSDGWQLEPEPQSERHLGEKRAAAEWRERDD